MKFRVLIIGLCLLMGCATQRVGNSTQDEGAAGETAAENPASGEGTQTSSDDGLTSSGASGDVGGNAPATDAPVSSTEAAPESPFLNTTFYVDPNSNAARQAASWRVSRPADAALLDVIAAQGWASWFGDWNSNIYLSVNSKVTTITNAGALPVLVAYNIPNRNCGGYSAGGAADSAAYLDWIQDFADAIGDRNAVVILEPDALGLLSCLSAADVAIRNSLLQQAVAIFKSHAQTYVYIDAGHANWIGASDMAQRLTNAGVALADGFALNVSNFYTTEENTVYGEAISALIADKHFVIDTSRNGLGSNGEWCNPSGRALGEVPSTHTGHDLIDALLWIKPPGESDGTCNGGPSAGAWWVSYALALVQNSL